MFNDEFGSAQNTRPAAIHLKKHRSVNDTSAFLAEPGTFPARMAVPGGYYYGGALHFFESGEVELRDQCTGSPTSMRAREAVSRCSNGRIQVRTWSEMPDLYLGDTKLTKRQLMPLSRYTVPTANGHTREVRSPAVLIDYKNNVAAPLTPGPHGVYCYWPMRDALPCTYSSWGVLTPDEEMYKGIAGALRTITQQAKVISSLEGSNTDNGATYSTDARKFTADITSDGFAIRLVDLYRQQGVDAMMEMVANKLKTPVHTKLFARAMQVSGSHYFALFHQATAPHNVMPFGQRIDSLVLKVIRRNCAALTEHKYLSPYIRTE